MKDNISITLFPIGFVHTDAEEVPKFWTESDVEGILVINENLREGIKDIKPDQYIEVIFYFHKSIPFEPQYITQYPRGNKNKKRKGIFSTRSPVRPNPIGNSILKVIDVENNLIYVRGLDIVDGTPILDIKPVKGVSKY
jgi:tRNA-Thr(GGU) m(6)t(6)A37 methyltransferase TsaA